MKLGEVVQKERLRKGVSLDEAARILGVSQDEYRDIESGASPLEAWAPGLAEIAIALEIPTSRLVSESGRSGDAAEGQVGRLIQEHRIRKGLTLDELARKACITREELERLESRESMNEKFGPMLLRFAEAIEQPVFNLFYPCGVTFKELDDYP